MEATWDEMGLTFWWLPNLAKFMASPRSYGYKFDEFIFGNSFDLTKGCRMGHWDLATSQDFTIKTLDQTCH